MCMSVSVVYERAALPESFWEKSFPFLGPRHPSIAFVYFARALRSSELFDYRVFSRVINHSIDFRKGVICSLMLQFFSRNIYKCKVQ